MSEILICGKHKAALAMYDVEKAGKKCALCTLQKDNEGLRKLVSDIFDDMKCLEGCGSVNGEHEDLCPVMNPNQAYSELRKKLVEKDRRIMFLEIEYMKSKGIKE